MTDAQGKAIFETIICVHWPNWPTGDEELVVWLKALRPFDYGMAKEAINEFYANWDSERYPKLPKVIAAVRNYAKVRYQVAEKGPLYQIEDENGKPVWKPFWGSLVTPQADIEVEADRLREEADRMFPEHKHRVRYLKPDAEPVPF